MSTFFVLTFFVACGGAVDNTQSQTAVTSDSSAGGRSKNGVNPEFLTSVASSSDNSRFVAVGNDGTIITSNDAQNWSINPVSGTQNNLNGVACSGGIGGICVLVGNSGEIATAPQTLETVNK